MELKITVPDDHRLALERRAQEQGYSDVSQYVERLISADLLATTSFDEILMPIRKTFQDGPNSEEQLIALFKAAREEIYQEHQAQEK